MVLRVPLVPTDLTLMHDTATGAGYGIGAAKGITGGRKGYKAALFEGGIGVPFIARWPGKIAAGKVDDQSLISAIDLLPTFCEIAGAKFPKGYKPDGISLVSTLKGERSPTRENHFSGRCKHVGHHPKTVLTIGFPTQSYIKTGSC